MSNQPTTIWREVLDRWRLVVAIAVGVEFVIIGIVLVLPRWYESQLAVVPSERQKLSSSVASAIAADLPLDLNLGSSDADRIQAVLKSRSVTDAVIDRFDLVRRYGKKRIEEARKTLWEDHCATKIDKKSSVVTLTCEDKDPETARAMTDLFGKVGNDVFRRISTSSAGEERRFLEKRVDETRDDVNRASDRLREFQEKYRIVDIGEQSKAVVSAIAMLRGEMMSKQLQLSYLNSFSSSDEATAQQLRQQLDVMGGQLHSLEDAPPQEGDGQPAAPGLTLRKSRTRPGLFPPAMSVPKIRFQLEQLVRDQKVQEMVYLLLVQRFELAKVNEARDTSAFQILDAPIAATEHSRPKRLRWAAAGVVVGFALGVFFAAAPLWRRRFSDLGRS